MSQDIWTSPLDPTTTSGTELASILDDFKDAVVTGMAGTTRPTELLAGGGWLDTAAAGSPTFYWSYKVWTGSVDIEVFRVNLNTGVATFSTSSDTFEILKVSADTAGAFLQLTKRRIATNGKVLSGDTVGTIEFIGRASDASNPICALIKWVASEDQTASVSGGYLSFQSTPAGTATATEHLKFISGKIEAVVTLKQNSSEMVGQNIATTATIAQMSAAQMLVEMTGSTATDIQGVNSGHASKVVTIHNRSTAVVTLKHENGTATAADRLKLPSSLDFQIAAQCSVTVYYCTADSRWKLSAIATANVSDALVPTGTIFPFAGTTAPSGYLLCYGQAVSRTTYANLYAVTSTTYGVGDGSTTFNLPDLRGRIAAGKDDMGGSAASRLTSATITTDATTLGRVGGTETHTLTLSQAPAHKHGLAGYTGGGAAQMLGVPSGGVMGASTGSGTPGSPYYATGSSVDFLDTQGGGTAHNNVQPTIILNQIIKT